jgi:hypothetical protein
VGAVSAVVNVVTTFFLRDELVNVVGAWIGPPLRAAGQAATDAALARLSEYCVYGWFGLSALAAVVLVARLGLAVSRR